MSVRARVAALGGIALLTACSWLPGLDEAQPQQPIQMQPLGGGDSKPELSPGQVYMEKGVHYMEQGIYDVALKDLTHAVELDADNSEAHNALAVLYQKIDDPVHADASFKKAIALKPDNFGALNNYGRFLCGRGRADEAFEQFRKVIATKLYNQPWIPLTNAGMCAKSVGKKTDAEAYFRQAQEASADFPPALLEMIKLSRDIGQYMSARAFLQRYLAAAGPSPESLQLGVDIENALGNAQTAGEYARTLKSMRTLPSSRAAPGKP